MVKMTPRLLKMERESIMARERRNPSGAYDSRHGLLGYDADAPLLLTESKIAKVIDTLTSAGLDQKVIDAIRTMLEADDGVEETREMLAPSTDRRAARDAREARLEARAMDQAEREVRATFPHLALDSASSAAGVYALGARAAGARTEGTHSSTWRQLFYEYRAKHRGSAPRVAMDSASARGFAERYPGAAKIKIDNTGIV